MVNTVLLLLSLTISQSLPASLTYLTKHPMFSSQHSERVFAGAGGEAVLHCQVSSPSSLLPPPTY